MKKIVFWLLIGIMLFGFAGAALATESEIELGPAVSPIEVNGNPLSGKGAEEHKVEPKVGESGTIEIPCDVGIDDLGKNYPDTSTASIEVKYQISEDGKYLSWESESQIEMAVVKGGNKANIYYYYDADGKYLGFKNEDTGMWYDNNLQSPLNKGGNVPEISNFGFFCSDGDNKGWEPPIDDYPSDEEEEVKTTPPVIGNGVFRTTTPPTFLVTPMSSPVALPQTGGISLLTILGLSLITFGSFLFKK
jgi:LPXTG-motif cell wall-anchored protein